MAKEKLQDANASLSWRGIYNPLILALLSSGMNHNEQPEVIVQNLKYKEERTEDWYLEQAIKLQNVEFQSDIKRETSEIYRDPERMGFSV